VASEIADCATCEYFYIYVAFGVSVFAGGAINDTCRVHVPCKNMQYDSGQHHEKDTELSVVGIKNDVPLVGTDIVGGWW